MSEAGNLIAVVGLSCRLPQAPDPASFWRLLRTGTDAITTVPEGRWGDPLPGRDAPKGPEWGGFLADVDCFDPEFFGISPREAAAMDPQQRLALELAWEALEDAGVPAGELRGTAAGVFMGAISDDYAALLRKIPSEVAAQYRFTGTHRSLIANRVSYVLGLRGPSLTVDSGQSSSLVGVHLASESLRRGECAIALAGGVNLNLAAESNRALLDFGALSPDGRCFTFDARANGYVRGEGGGLVVLKKADQARADGDRIYCLIRGSAVNNDGGGAGLTVPAADAQAELLRQAYRNAGVDPAAVQYVELHGSATRVGDPVEAAALGAVLGAARRPGDKLRVGSAKTNVGHLEAAAGVTGLLKTALSIWHRELPPSLHFTAPNPEIPLDELNLRVQRDLRPWPESEGPLLAGVSAFGMGGTNCHLVLSDSSQVEPRRSGPAEATMPWVLSARTPVALRAQAARLHTHLNTAGQSPLDVAYSLATTRSALPHRAALVADDEPKLLAGLKALADGDDAPALCTGTTFGERAAVFVFPGQGSQWIGMGRQLLGTSEVFAASIDACAEALAPHLDWSLLDVLRDAAGAPQLDRDDVVQPALFAVMVSLAELWRSWGVRPEAVVGHSQGEIAAACVAGALSVRDAARVVAVRSRLLTALAGRGAMASFQHPVEEVRQILLPWRDRIGVAGVNGPASTLVSGDREAMADLLAECARRELRMRRIPVEYASHSPHIEDVRDELLALLAPIEPRTASIPIYSTTTGELLDRPVDADYWYRNLRQPVLFEAAVEALLTRGHNAFIEISPHPVLTASIQEIAARASREVVALGTLRRDEGGLRQALTSLAKAHVHGVAADWHAVFAGTGAQRIDLPTYAFQRQRYWLDTKLPDVATPERDVSTALREKLRSSPTADADSTTLTMIRAQAAAVLGHSDPKGVDPDRTFKDLGFDSSTVVELCDRLNAATGLRLAPSVVFDCPTPYQLARQVRMLLLDEPAPMTSPRPESEADEPIAVIGMGCRFPGGVSSPEELWQLVAAGRDVVSEFPADRGWDLERAGTSQVRAGGFLHGATDFDPGFFGISPREALVMDPQQRLLLEIAWEAIERGGINPQTLHGSQTGVFVGATSLDYGPRLHEATDEAAGYVLTGSTTSVASGRVAYSFGFEGPAVTVDTACSSSLVALHLACQSLRSGECDSALAGGVTVMATPGMFVEFSRQRGLAPDGRCKSFAEAADGTGWSEGAGLVLLERLSDARRNGHEVLAVVRGSAVNQDGASNGLTAPNGPSQRRVIIQALANAKLSVSDVDAVEAHGTGTRLGDPIEAQALIATYGQGRGPERPLWLGSMKSNIGHAQAAAGIAGVIKMVMAMRHEQLPATLHVDEPTSQVDWSAGVVRLLTEHMSWPENGRPRRAGVSSFGISGTNAHVILEQSPTASSEFVEHSGPDSDSTVDVPVVPWVVSGKTPEALNAQTEALLSYLDDHSDVSALDVAYSLASERAALDERAVVLGSDREALMSGLEAPAAGREASGVVSGSVISGRIGFVFSGQGGQWLGMGRGLYSMFPAFADAFDEACAQLDAHLGQEVGVRDVVFGSDAQLLERTLWAQSGLFALQVGLLRLLGSWGVRPDVVLGHSVGELAAAHAAGVLSLPEAARLVAGRARLMQALPDGGAMLAVAAGEEQLRPLLADRGDRVGIAAVNAPESVVLSGDREVLEDIAGGLDEQGVRWRWLRVSHAFHSYRMDPMLDEFAEISRTVNYRRCDLPVVSTLTGELDDAGMLATPEYWVRQVREPVRFAEGVRALVEHDVATVVELGPDGALSALIQECAAEFDQVGRVAAVPAMRRNRDEAQNVTTALAQVHVRGVPVDWSAFFAGSGAKRVELPTYAFQRQRYWLESSVSGDVRGVGLAGAEHPLLGAVVVLADGDGMVLTGRLSVGTHPWLAEHRVLGEVVVPGTAILEMALHAGARVGCGRVEELTLEAPLVVPERDGIEVQLLVNAPDEDGRRSTSLYSRPAGVSGGGGWTRHATGELTVGTGGGAVADWSIEGAESIALGEFYVAMAGNGFEYGPLFQGLRAAWRRGGEVLAEVALPAAAGAMASGFLIDPALLDAALQASALSDRPAEGGAWLPFSFTGVELSVPGGTVSRVRLQTSRPDAISVAVMDEGGRLLASIDSLRLRPVSSKQPAYRDAVGDALFEVTWEPVATRSTVSGRWALLGDVACGRAGLIELAPGSADRCAGLAELAGQLDSSALVPDVVVYCAGEQADPDAGAAALAETQETLALLQSWLAEPRLAGARLVVVTRAAVTTGAGDGASGLAHAPLWGLLRSAQSENPGRFVLVDVDGTAESWRALPTALGAREPQVALRKGAVRAPRVASVPPPVEVPAVVAGPDRTVLISGGTGLLGGLVARHLVAERGVRRVVLAGRRGWDAPGITELVGELEGFGAVVDVVACDVADRGDLERLLAAVPAEFPLCGVVHAAGVLADGVIESLSPEDVAAVFGPKAAGAWYLHELTRDMDLSFFALFSSLSGVTGAAGQGNYAAANAFLDALAYDRRAQGLPAVSLAWGLWEQPSGMTERLSDVDRSRIARSNPPLSTKDGLRLFDAGLALDRAAVVPARLDRTFLAEQARSGTLPAMLTALVPAITSIRRSAGTDLADEDALLTVVREHAARVLGYSGAAEVGVERAFRDLGFDSLSGVDLRNRLAGVLGARLPATAVFDYPTPRALARFLHQELAGKTGTTPGPVTTTTATASVEADLIAIVGMGCRYPGGVSSPEELWRLVTGGVDAVADFPDDRGWDLERLFDPDPDHLGTSYVREGGFLRDAAEFDAGFFGISPREALAMDPQQRLLLELSWETVERAGIDPGSLRGSRTGVFAGLMYHDYAGRFASRAPEGFEGYLGNGSAGSVASGRVAYSFGFEGPAVTVDTACSSSLVALHLAGQSLRSGECDLALAGGVTVMATPATFVEFSRQRGLAPDGRCKSFAEGADGTGWGEGAGLVLLERLSDARRNGHRVLAVVRGSAVNQDGASNGLTAPNGPSQQRVIQQALANADLGVSDVDAVEAHGTGTRLGDPIEAQALIATYGRDRERGRPLWLGSMKSNIGHTQAAAGVAGVIKMVMAMRHGQLPRTLHVDEPTSEVDWSAGTVQLLTENTPWPDSGRVRRAGVSSFGISGTNAHVILEQPTEETSQSAEPDSSSVVDVPVVPWVVSGKTPEALSAQAATLMSDLDNCPDASSLDVAYSLAAGRAALDERAVVLGSDRDALLTGLRALASGRDVPEVVSGFAGNGGRIGFVFSGQGGQWPGMGRRLHSVFPAFADAFDEACAQLDEHLGQEVGVRDVVFGSDAQLLERTLWAQSGLFALQVGLLRLLGSWGVRPDVVLGHSVGELAAAHAAGVLSLPEAARLVAGRARLMQALPQGGGMLAVVASENQVESLLDGVRDRIGIAAINAPESIVLSGDGELLTEVADQLHDQGYRTRWLRVSHAFHSPQMEPMLDEFAEIARTVDFRGSDLPVVSTLTGALDDVGVMATPEYWVRQVREPVRFADGVQALVEHDVATVVELGPDGALSALIPECAAEFDQSGRVAAVPAMRRNRDEAQNVMTALAQVYVRGVPVDWRSFFAGTGAKRVELPTYAFQRQRYWLNAVHESSADDMGRHIETEFWSAVEHEDVTSLANVLGIVDDGAAVDSLRNALPVLGGWQRTRNTESIMDQQCYRIDWRQVAGLPPRGTVFGTWLVFAPHGWSSKPEVVNCVAALRARGGSVVLVEADDSDPISFGDRVGTLCSDRPDLVGVLSMLCLEESILPGFSTVSRGFALTVELVRALAAAGADARLWLLTCGGVSVGDVPVRPEQALVWGLGRVVGLEHPDWWGGLIDLPVLFDEDAQARLSIVLAGLGEDEVAIRSDGVFARRLVRHGVSAGVKKAWRPSGSVLVTGGTGGLGAHAARWLADAGAEHVVMVSRRGEQAPSAEKLRTELEGLGTRVSIPSCDVTDREALAEVLKALPAEYPLTAVVHTAGVIETGDAASMSLADFDDVLSAKVAGAANLDALLADVELDAFVLFSSVSGVWGAGGQGAYAAANAYLDALAEERRSRGLVATAVAWGPWAGEGMAAGETGDQLRRYGLSPMAPQYAIAGIRRALEQDETSLVVADVDWARFGAGFLAARPRPLLNELAEVKELLADAQSEAGVLADASVKWRQRLAAAPRPAQEQLILELVRNETALVLGHSGPEAVASERAFKDSGFDSQAAVELRVRLNRATGLQLPSTIIFSHPTPAELAAELRARLLPESAGADIPEQDEARIRAALTSISFAALREAGLVDPLLALAGHPVDSGSSPDDAVATSIDAMDVADLVEAALGERES
ncbi:type I polyketide synthase [Saccharopolyspora sp. ASAGF58]|uniref:type I polyketide synthase n=1 Tax=Saccharopolyspora sp. ASAGF58 TaxID=2719023 RepID=UPI0014451056|nr:type I polyketide synthase [Saccharopolyspora sp. ASAGF58]